MARPRFKPTAAQLRKVAVAAGAGMSHEEIALGLDIARNTLERHFSHELSVGAYKKRLEMFDALHKAGKKGNVAAIKLYTSMTPRVAAPPEPDAVPLPDGKKAQANLAAKTAQVGTDWDKLLPNTSLPQ